MTNSKTTRKALLSSALAMSMCVAMLIATTFAWFTDTASTSVNKIQAGKLDVALEMKNPDYGVEGKETKDTEWISAEGATLKWVKAAEDETTSFVDSNDILWEPGCTYNLQDVRVVNNGNLALKYQVQISGLLGNAELLNAIDFTVKIGDGDAVKLENWDGTLKAGEKGDAITITGTMKSDAGNGYQGLSIDGIAITVVATQLASEFDSNSNDYDEGAVLPVSAKAKGNLTVEQTETDEKATVKTQQELYDDVMTVTYPAGVVLKRDTSVDGTTTKKATVEQTLTYVGAVAKGSGVTINDTTQAVASYDLTLPVADENTTLVTVEINYTKGLNIEKIYHDGVELTKVTEAPSSTTGNECFMYDKDSGVITLYLKHASPIDIVYGKPGVTSKEGKTLNDVFGGTDFDFGYGNTSTEAVTLDGKGTAVVTDWVDAWVNSDTTIKGVTFKHGAAFNAEKEGITVTFENCTFYACDQQLLLDAEVQRTDNSGDGLCLNVETRNKKNVTYNVKNCKFIGDGGENVDRGSRIKVNNDVKKRGHAIGLNVSTGRCDDNPILLIEGCTIDNTRGNAIQLYGTTGEITIKDTQINSWGQNKEHKDYAIRGDFAENSTTKTITLSNVYFGLDENKTNRYEIGHINVGKFPGNTSGTKKAGTYSYPTN